MPEDEIQQQQQPLGTDGNEAGSLGGGGNPTAGSESTYQRVTPEEAASLPYAELRQRMREEAELHEQGLLPPASTTGAGAEDTDEENTAGNAGQGNDGQRQSSADNQPGGNGQQSSDLQRLLAEAQKRTVALEQENREARETRQREALETQHRNVEQEIRSLPANQQEIARQAYMNRLGQQALNDYYGFLQQREAAVRQAEIGQARVLLPNLLGELAENVAQRHGIKADRLKEYVTSAQFKELLTASQTEEALTAAAANAGQWMEFLAVQEETRLATEREQRRQKAIANPRQRDTPAGGVPAAGGEADIVRRINSMSRDEFFAWKKQQLAEAANR